MATLLNRKKTLIHREPIGNCKSDLERRTPEGLADTDIDITSILVVSKVTKCVFSELYFTPLAQAPVGGAPLRPAAAHNTRPPAAGPAPGSHVADPPAARRGGAGAAGAARPGRRQAGPAGGGRAGEPGRRPGPLRGARRAGPGPGGRRGRGARTGGGGGGGAGRRRGRAAVPEGKRGHCRSAGKRIACATRPRCARCCHAMHNGCDASQLSTSV